MTTRELIESFYRYATDKLSLDHSECSVDELYAQWRSECLPIDDHAENVAAIQASIDDLRNGVQGREATEFLRELRAEVEQSQP